MTENYIQQNESIIWAKVNLMGPWWKIQKTNFFRTEGLHMSKSALTQPLPVFAQQVKTLRKAGVSWIIFVALWNICSYTFFLVVFEMYGDV